MSRMRQLAVYCGSASPKDPVYADTARMVGRTLAERGIGVVYGGGKLGLLGAVADSALEAGGEVTGVIPQALVDVEVAHRGCTRLIAVDNMHQRKARFTELSDGFLVLPGGVGTMDELWEAVSWSQLGYHSKPVGLLNVAGFYDGLLEFNARMIEVGFIREAHRGIIIADTDLAALLNRMESYAPHRNIFAMKASDL
jgi:uncharacterized protein (TIGR00730 family)